MPTPWLHTDTSVTYAGQVGTPGTSYPGTPGAGRSVPGTPGGSHGPGGRSPGLSEAQEVDEDLVADLEAGMLEEEDGMDGAQAEELGDPMDADDDLGEGMSAPLAQSEFL